jgi:cation:H+ antiporter
MIAGFMLLVVGAEMLVRGSVAVARRLEVSPLLIGLALVGFGTSSPELVASISAALQDSPGIAVGNVVGSNIVNILLILGSAAVIAPMRVTRAAYVRDGPVLIGATAAMIAVCLYGIMSPAVGAGFLGLLAGYIVYAYRSERQGTNASADRHAAEGAALPQIAEGLAKSLGAAAAGMAALIGGAYLFVGGAISLARQFGISETVIGLSLVAVGTSLPELATSVIAAARRNADVAVGNVVGSNIYNIFGIVGTTAVVAPIPIPKEIVAVDIWVMLASTAVFLLLLALGWRLSRWAGALFLAAYAAYVWFLAATAASAGSTA